MATCTVARIFTNSILSAVCGAIRVIRATEQVAILSIEMVRVDSCDSCDSWAKKEFIRGQNNVDFEFYSFIIKHYGTTN